MRRSLAVVVLSLLLAPAVVRAADIPASYLVDQKALKDAVAGTPVTFALFADGACTAPAAYTATVPIEGVTVVAKLSEIVAKGAPKGPKAAELRTTLTGVTAMGNLWLEVTGTGVTPIGAACQAQSGQVAQTGSGGLSTKAVVLEFSDVIVGQWGIETPTDVGLPASTIVTAVDRQAAATLQALDPATAYGCTIELVSPLVPQNINNMVLSNPGTPSTVAYVPIFGLSGCTPACSDGVRDGKETDIDCGGDTACARCPAGDFCNGGGDCASGQCTLCRFCSRFTCQ